MIKVRSEQVLSINRWFGVLRASKMMDPREIGEICCWRRPKIDATRHKIPRGIEAQQRRRDVSSEESVRCEKVSPFCTKRFAKSKDSKKPPSVKQILLYRTAPHLDQASTATLAPISFKQPPRRSGERKRRAAASSGVAERAVWVLIPG